MHALLRTLALAALAPLAFAACKDDKRVALEPATCESYCDYVSSVCGIGECAQVSCDSAPAALKECLLAAGGSDCDAIDYEVATCKAGGTPVTGTVANGAPCSADAECKSGVCNAAGACGYLPAGTGCRKDAECRSGVCNSKKVCGAAPDGATCAENRDCSTGLCNAQKTCGPEPIRCTSGDACPDGVCTSLGTCGKRKDGAGCGVDGDCATNFCNSAKICGKGASGAACAAPTDCTANFCTSLGTCGRNADGKPCKVATDCATGVCNAAGTCGKLAIGQPCTADDQCATGTCRGASCGNTVTTVSAGGDHTCAVAGDARVFCWGKNDFGQAGTGCTGPLCARAVRMPTFGSVTTVAAGGAFTCAIRGVKNEVSCWGKNDRGQLGDGSGQTQKTPVTALIDGSATALAAGEDHACAVLIDGRISCWGRNDFGQLGDGTQTPRALPVIVQGLPSGLSVEWVGIYSRGHHTCAIQRPNVLWCWGDNRFGQVLPGGAAAVTRPTQHPISSGPPVQYLTTSAVAPGFDHTCAQTSGGVSCWGANGALQLGRGVLKDPQTQAVLTMAPAGFTAPRIDATQIDAGQQFTCAVTASGLQCWGVNGSGQLEDGTTTPQGGPKVANALGSLSVVTAGRAHACAARTKDTVVCWGDGTSGQLGDGRSGANVSATRGVTVLDL